LAADDTIDEIKVKIGSQLAREGRAKTAPESYGRWRVIFMSPVREATDPHARLRDLDVDPTMVHKVLPRQ